MKSQEKIIVPLVVGMIIIACLLAAISNSDVAANKAVAMSKESNNTAR